MHTAGTIFNIKSSFVFKCRCLPIVLLTIAAHVAHHDIDAQHCMHSPSNVAAGLYMLSTSCNLMNWQ